MKTEVPIYLLSGENDPVGEFGKGVLQTEELLIRQGARIKGRVLFPQMRHDILHERRKEKVYKYIEKAMKGEGL